MRIFAGIKKRIRLIVSSAQISAKNTVIDRDIRKLNKQMASIYYQTGSRVAELFCKKTNFSDDGRLSKHLQDIGSIKCLLDGLENEKVAMDWNDLLKDIFSVDKEEFNPRKSESIGSMRTDCFKRLFDKVHMHTKGCEK
jgi:hypothetical protein